MLLYLPLFVRVTDNEVRADSEYWRVRLLSSIMCTGDLLVELAEYIWDPEDVEDADGDTEPADWNLIGLRRDRFIAAEALSGGDSGKEYTGEWDNGGDDVSIGAVASEISVSGGC